MKKNILVVDDSALMRRVECDIINSDSNFEAIDVCRDGLEAYEKLLKRYNIGYNRVSDLYCLDIYSNNCKESDIIKRILNNFNHKYFIQVMNVDFKQSAE